MVTPLYTPLLLAFLTSVDQNNGIWKLLLAQRVSRAPLHAAKLGVGFPLVAWSQVVLLAACLGIGFPLPALRPELGDYKPGVDVPHVVTMLALAYVAGFLIDRHSVVAGYEVSEFCLASWSRNLRGDRERSRDARRVAPKMLAVALFLDAARLRGLQPRDTLQRFYSIQHLLLLSVLGAALVTALALWNFRRRDVA